MKKFLLAFGTLFLSFVFSELIEAATYTKNYSNGTHDYPLEQGSNTYIFCTATGRGCKTVIYKYDPIPPTCSVSDPHPSDWTNGSVSFTATCSDSMSGCSTSSDTKSVSSEGGTASFSFIDNVGNTGTCSKQATNIDTTAPTCTASLNPSATWTNNNITASATCADLGGDANPNGTSNDNSGCTRHPDNKTISVHNGSVTFDVEDNVGNVNTNACTSIAANAWIDKLSPVITNLQLEHTGMSLVSESASIDSASPNQFRADDGSLYLYFDAVDADEVDGANGRSGLYFKDPIIADAQSPRVFWKISITRDVPGTNSNQTFIAPLVFIQPADPSSAATSHDSLDQFSDQDFTEKTYFFDLNQFKFDGESNPIFATTGSYTLTLKIFDKAGNDQTATFYIDIFPGDANNGTSTLGDFDCTTNHALANNLDTCTAKLTAKDEFGNAIFGREFQAYFAEQDTEGSYNLLANTDDPAQTAFQNGLRFDRASAEFAAFDSVQKHTQAYETAAGNVANPGTGETPDIAVSSLVPTLQIYESNEIAHLSQDPKAHLASEIPRNTEIVFVSPEIDKDGTESASATVEISYEPSFQFGRWVKSTIDGDENILLDEQKTMNISASTEYGSKNLPTDFEISLKGWAPESTEFDEQDLGNTGNISSGNLDGISSLFENISVPTKTIDLKTHLRGIGDNVLTNLKTAFTSQIKIPVSDLDENATEREVIYPGGNFGNTVGNQQQLEQEFDEEDLFEICPNNYCDSTGIEGFTIGANISGNILTSGTSAIQSQSSTAVDLGGIEVKDIREETTANAYEIIRGMAPIPLEENQVITENFLEEKDVFYYSGGTVKIEPLTGDYAFSGVKTLLIEDGNLLIAGDMQYAGPTDSLGVILINSNIGEKPDTGNIFVNKDVKKFVGTYFADGSLTSTTKTGETNSIPDIGDELDRDADRGGVLDKQLLLEGTLFTKNTLGGSYLDPMQNPWGEEDDIADAQKYDLHFVRRYSPLLFPEEEKIDYCVNISETQCDPEGSSFLIRPDNRVQFFPPPGFRD